MRGLIKWKKQFDDGTTLPVYELNSRIIELPEQTQGRPPNSALL